MLRPACTLISCCYTPFGRCFVADEVSNNLNNINGRGLYHSIRGNLEKNAGILLANPLQSSSSTFSCVCFPSLFAFKEGMWDTHISALLNSPTVAILSKPLIRGSSREDASSVY